MRAESNNITTLPANTYLVTLDVSSLNANIPQDEGIAACKSALLSRSTHVNLFMAKLEESFLCRESTLKPYVWWRYIDDIFVICKRGEENLKVFVEDLKLLSSINQVHCRVVTQFYPIPQHLYCLAGWLSLSGSILQTYCSNLQQTAAIHATVNHQFHSANP